MSSVYTTKRNLLSMSSVNKNKGITLVEVMVALVVLTIGLLGLASLQANSLRFNDGALTRTEVTQLAYDITDRMRANRAGALAGDYNLALTNNHTATGTVAEQDLTAWINEIVALLPNGQGAIVAAAGNTRFTITVQWQDTRVQAAPQSFAFLTEL